MPRIKCLDIFDHFVLQERKKGNICTYQCKYCKKCVVVSSSSRLKAHHETCNQFLIFNTSDDDGDKRNNAKCFNEKGGSITTTTTSCSSSSSTSFSYASPSSSSYDKNTSGLCFGSLAASSSGSTSGTKNTNNSTSGNVEANSAKLCGSDIGSKAKTFGASLKITNFTDSINKKQVHEINHYLARWMYTENVPFKMMNSQYFKDFMQCLRPAYINHMPSSYQLSNTMLDEYYEEMKNKTSLLISNTAKMCVVTDGWSNIRGDSVINFMLTTPKPVFYTSLVASGDSHTGVFIGEKICNVISDVGSDKICGLVTDNAANMKAAWDYVQSKYPHVFCVGCTAHGMHLLCSDLTKVELVRDACTSAESVVSYFKNHHKPKFELEQQQRRMYNKTIVLKMYVPTRWGTIHAMFSSIISSKDALIAVAGFVAQTNIRNHLLDANFWQMTEYMESFFKPVVESISLFEKDESQLASVYPQLFLLQQHFKNVSKDCIRDEVLSIFEKRWRFMVSNTTLLAHFLHPQMHGKKLEDIQLAGLRIFLKDKFSSDFTTIWSELLQYKAKSGIFGGADIWEDAQMVDSITWWSCYGNNAHHLKNLAISVLNIPCSSAASERCWSTMGHIHSDARNRLTDDKVQKLTYVYFNERMLQSKL